jgi:hypothetical protein
LFPAENPSQKAVISRPSNKLPQLRSGAPRVRKLAGMGGIYCHDVDVAEILPPDSASNVGVRSYAIDPGAAQRLWSLSERLTGVKFEQ